jgi:hypothetical protein
MNPTDRKIDQVRVMYRINDGRTNHILQECKNSKKKTTSRNYKKPQRSPCAPIHYSRTKPIENDYASDPSPLAVSNTSGAERVSDPVADVSLSTAA